MSDLDRAIQKARKLAQTPEGMQLAQALRKMGGNEIQQAVDRAATGDTEAAKQVLSALMQDPKTRQILEQFGGSYGK